MPVSQERRFLGIEQLSLRSLLLGCFGSAIITASSMYVALRLSALPWPTIFVAVLSMALLKALGGTTQNEINITQTSMSAGAMVAGGLAFTLPGLWISKVWSTPSAMVHHFWPVFTIALAGVVLGTVFTWLLRRKFVEGEALPYPIGAAAAETIILGDGGGKRAVNLFGSMGVSALFTYLRDQVRAIPSSLISKGLYANNFRIGIWLSPMAAGIGYMIGTLYTGVWFLGAVLAYLVVIPGGVALGIFPSADQAAAFKNTVGIGLMIGTGVGILLAYLYRCIRAWGDSRFTKSCGTAAKTPVTEHRFRFQFSVWLAIAASFVFSVASGLNPLVSVLIILGVTAASAMAAIITGQTGINPMEIFGIIVLLAIRLVISVDTVTAFFIAAIVAVACGYSGDLLNEYKAGHILGTNPLAQLIAQIAGGIVGALVSAVSMFAIIAQFGGVGPEKGLTAGQAFAVSQMVHGVGDPMVLGCAVFIGALLFLCKLPTMTLGIGLYLPFEISSIVFLGGLIRFICERFRPRVVEDGNITASGMLGGEGVTGVLIAIIKMTIRG